MTPKQRIYAILEGKNVDRAPFHLYITWPEYGWKLTGFPVWEILFGELDGIEIFDKILKKHISDIAHGPVGKIGNGWLKDKKIIKETHEYVFFECTKTNKKWRFDINSHVLVEIDDSGCIIPSKHPGNSRLAEEIPTTLAEAQDWFEKRYRNIPYELPPPQDELAVKKWGKEYFMVTSTLGPFVSVAYSFGFEQSMFLLAEYPDIFINLAELFIQRYEIHYEWAKQAGYDCGHMVESWCSADVISPDTYKNWIAPIHRQAVSMIKSKGLKAELYNPGWSIPLLPFFREQGWDIIRFDDQCHGAEQDIAVIRNTLGSEQCLYGNMNAYSLLGGNWDDIAERTRYQYEKGAKTGPFIMSNGSGICDKTEPEIIDRWIDYYFTLSQEEN